jgi:alginate O-acetyltransferase complex protein AlgJ
MNKLLVVVFVAIISLPLAANIAGIDGADAREENRTLAEFPHLDRSWASWRAYPGNVSAWFEDHFGFRSMLVRWSAEARLFGLGVSPAPSVIVGDDGWYFYGEDASIDDYARTEPLTGDAVANWRAAVVAANTWLKEHHVAYVFTIAPDKYVVYPEHMPSSLVQVGSHARMDQIYDALQGSGVATVDVRPLLAAAKQGERIYQKTDTHWNERGVLVAYRALIDAVRAQRPDVPPAWTRDDFEPVTRIVPGMDLAGMMGLKRVLREEDLALAPKRRRAAVVVEPPGASPRAEEGRVITEIAGSTLPRAVIFRDSFTSPLVPFLSEHFSRAVYLWQNDFDADVVRREHADVVIQQIVGRHLYTFAPSPELVPVQ